MPLGNSGKHWSNPHQMMHHGDGPKEHEGSHSEIHHVEIHPHGENSSEPHHTEMHFHDGREPEREEHGNFDEAAEHAKMKIDGLTGDDAEAMEGEQADGEPMGNMRGKAKMSDSGGY